MANHDLQVVLHHTSGLPENDFINTLHYDVNAPDTLSGTMDDVAAAYNVLLPIMSADIQGMTIKSYPPGLNPGGPEEVNDYAYAPGGAAGPYEVAICLSYATVPDPEASTPRRRGRIYVGPLAQNAMGGSRPDSTLRDYILDFGEALASAGNLGNSTWRMLSRLDNTYADIESIWVDDAYDTQRRRGLAPSMRDTRTVQ